MRISISLTATATWVAAADGSDGRSRCHDAEILIVDRARERGDEPPPAAPGATTGSSVEKDSIPWREHADDSAMRPPFNALRDELEGVNDPPDMIQRQQQGGQCASAARAAMIPA
jgi:hypothetical protein